MTSTSTNELRQIKWILLAILAFVTIIACALVPAIMPILVLAPIGYVAYRISPIVRRLAHQTWLEITSLWHS